MPEILNLTRVTYVVTFGIYILNLSWGIIDPTVAPYLEVLGASSKQIGTIISSRFLMVAIFSIPFALIASKIGHFYVFMFSGIVGIVGVFFLNYFHGFNGILYFYYAIGLSTAAASGPAAAIMADNTGHKRIAAFSLFATTYMFPPGIGAGLSAYWFRGASINDYTVSKLSSIFPIVMYVTVPGLVIFILLLIWDTIKDRNSEIKGTTTKSDLSIVGQFQLIFQPIVLVPVSLLMVVSLMAGAGAGATLPFLTPFLKGLGASPDGLSLLVLALNFGMGIATQFTTPLAKRFGDLRVYVATTILSVVCLIGIVFSHTLVFAAIFYIFRGMFANMNTPITNALVLSYIDQKVRATGSAIATNIRWFGWVLFSPISGSIIDSLGYQASFLFTAVIYLVAMSLFSFVILTKPNLEQYEMQNNLQSDLYPSLAD